MVVLAYCTALLAQTVNNLQADRNEDITHITELVNHLIYESNSNKPLNCSSCKKPIQLSMNTSAMKSNKETSNLTARLSGCLICRILRKNFEALLSDHKYNFTEEVILTMHNECIKDLKKEVKNKIQIIKNNEQISCLDCLVQDGAGMVGAVGALSVCGILLSAATLTMCCLLPPLECCIPTCICGSSIGLGCLGCCAGANAKDLKASCVLGLVLGAIPWVCVGIVMQ